jgi:hypothetical protein
MKSLLLLFTILLTAFNTYGQEIKISEPEFSGNAVYVDKATGTGMPLETMTSSQKTKAKASVYLVGVGKVHTDLSIKGTTSTVRINQKERIQFIYRGEDNSTNPKECIQIIKFKIKGNNRVAELASLGTFSGMSSGDMGFVEFSATKYGSSSYLITIVNLAPGEYGFSFGKASSKLVHLFTVTGNNETGYINSNEKLNNTSNLNIGMCAKYMATKKTGNQLLIAGGSGYLLGTVIRFASGSSTARNSGSLLQFLGILSAGAGLTLNLVSKNNLKNANCSLNLNISPSSLGLAYNF